MNDQLVVDKINDSYFFIENIGGESMKKKGKHRKKKWRSKT